MGTHWWQLAPWAVVAAWIYLLVAHGRYWSTHTRLGAAGSAGSAGSAGAASDEPLRWPSVAIIVPARNEAALLAKTLPGLVAQDYPGEVRIVLVDDSSTDATAEVARNVGGGGRVPLSVIAGVERPEGWAGKLWALQQGVLEVGSATVVPQWLLFTDADIAHPPNSLRRLVAGAIAERHDMVSLMARLRVATGWERLLVPAFVYFFAQLYPFRRVAKQGRTAAAAGGCILVRASALAAAGGIASIRGAVIDDIALARALKRSGASIWLGLADDVHSVRPYPRLDDLWQMVTRSAFNQLRYSTILLVGTLVGLVALYIGPLVSLIAGLATADVWLIAEGTLSWAIMTVTYLPMVRYYRLHPGWALTLPGAAALYGAMTADSARRHWQGRGVEWKGRQYL